MSCIFCGADDITPEHVLARWIGRLRITRKRSVVQRRDVDTGATTTEMGALFDDVVGPVCQKRCNGGWMSDLENECRDMLEPLIRGYRGARLSGDDQLLLARWFSKTALMASLLDEPLPIPKSHFEWLYRKKAPPPFTTIWAGHHPWNEGQGRATSYRRSVAHYQFNGGAHLRTSIGPLAPSEVNAYRITVTVYSLAFSVVCIIPPRHRRRVEIERPLNVARAAFRMWPEPVPITWPPDEPLDDLGVAALHAADDKFTLF